MSKSNNNEEYKKKMKKADKFPDYMYIVLGFIGLLVGGSIIFGLIALGINIYSVINSKHSAKKRGLRQEFLDAQESEKEITKTPEKEEEEYQSTQEATLQPYVAKESIFD